MAAVAGPYGPNRWARRMGLLGLALVTVLMAVPPVASATDLAGGAGATATGNHAAATPPPAPRSIGSPAQASYTLPGPLVDPATVKPVSPEMIGTQPFSFNSSATAPPQGAPASAGALSSGLPGGVDSPVVSVHTSASTVKNGWVKGYVYNLTSKKAISGAGVAVFSLGGFCNPEPCGSKSTLSDGSFNITAPAGLDEIYVTDPAYLDNETTVTVNASVTLSVGTIYMVPYGFVYGRVVYGDSAHGAVVGALVSSQSRDGRVTGNVNATTDSNGYFTLHVPPMPVKITVTPPPNTESNWTWANVTSGQGLYLGWINITRETLVTAELYDAVTRTSLSPANIWESLTSCSRINGKCLPDGEVTGPYPAQTTTLRTLAVPGATYVKARAADPNGQRCWEENVTAVADVPPEASGKVFDLGKIYLTECGYITIDSNFTYGAVGSTYSAGEVEANTCSIDALNIAGVVINYNVYPPVINTTTGPCTGGCYFPGGHSPAEILAPPLRVDVKLIPDLAGPCNPPISSWSIPPHFPIPLVSNNYVNETWGNVTPGRITRLGNVDITPGAYVDGQVYLNGTKWAPRLGFSVQACSTDVPSWCGPGVQGTYYYYQNQYRYPPSPSPPSGCSILNTSFCVPVPPGPFTIKVTAPGYSSNYTWGYLKPGSFNLATKPVTLASVTRPSITSINVSNGYLFGGTGGQGANGSVSGSLLLQGTSVPPTGLASVTACPALAASSILPCAQGDEDPATGKFVISDVPLGWDQIQATAPLVQSNWTWVFVSNSTNLNVGPLYMLPYSGVAGQVITPGGNGILFAHMAACPIVDPQGCSSLGFQGQTGTDGRYFGVLAPGFLPIGVYEILASAPGYTTNWVWVNVTPYNTTAVPPITLYPVGNATASPAGVARGIAASVGPRPSAASANLSAGIWVDGRIYDNVTLRGIEGATILACPVGSFTCDQFTDTTSPGGEFNDTVPYGEYYLNVSMANYYPVSVLFNGSIGAVIHLGSIGLNPYPWVTGRVLIDPWESLGLNLSKGGQGASAMAMSACALGVCAIQTFARTNSGGFYNISSPYGQHVIVTAVGTQAASGGTSQGGYLSESTSVNVTEPYTTAPAFVVPIFSIVTGKLRDRTANDTTPARFIQTAISVLQGPNAGTATEIGNGGGIYWFLMPPNNTKLRVITGGPPDAYVAANNSSVRGVGPGDNVSTVENLSLTHYGWVEMYFVSRAGGASVPAPFAFLTATVADPLNGTFLSIGAQANGAGFLNMSTPPTYPPGTNASFMAVGLDFNNTTHFFAPVYPGRTTYLFGNLTSGGGNLTGPAGNISLEEWGIVRTTQVNELNGAPLVVSVVDKVRQTPLWGAFVSVVSPLGITSSNLETSTNGLGQFITDAAPSPRDNLTVGLGGYVTNLTSLNVTAGSVVVVRSVNLTGDGVVGGRVMSYPGNQPVPGATVTLTCAVLSAGCKTTNATTNSSGEFWVLASPGLSVINVSAPGFVSNANSIVKVCSDCFVWFGTIKIDEFAYVTGQVVGLPSGIPLIGANVSLCSPLGLGCGQPVTTDRSGDFRLPTPAGSYLLQVNATGYNATFIPVSLVPGEVLPFYPIFLEQFGYVIGTVLSASTFTPILSATMVACPLWTGVGSNCTAFFHTGAFGRYEYGGPPGPYQVQVVAPGYLIGDASQSVESGVTRLAPTILLAPIGSNTLYNVSGSVVLQNGSVPVSGATVAAVVNGTVAASTTSSSTGAFTLRLLFGSYTLVAIASGDRPALRPLNVTGPLSGIVLSLVPMTYTVSGFVTDGDTGSPLAGVTLTIAGTVVGVSDVNGFFGFPLTNGTYELVATAPSNIGLSYAPVQFSLSVNGAPVVRNVALYPPTSIVYGTVVDLTNGLPVPQASVVMSGETVNGLTFTTSLVVRSSGVFELTVPQGNYTVTVSAAGYRATSGSVDANGPNVPVLIELRPAPAPPPPGASLWGTWLPIGLVIGIVAALLVSSYYISRRPVKKVYAPAPSAPGAPERKT